MMPGMMGTMPVMQHPLMAMPGAGMAGIPVPGMAGMPGMMTMPGMGMPQMMQGMQGMQGMMVPAMASNPQAACLGTESESEEQDDVMEQQRQQQAQQPALLAGVPAQPASSAMVPSGQPEQQLQQFQQPIGMIYNKDDTAGVTRSTTLLRGLPRVRLLAALEKLDGEMDAGFLSNLSQKGLLILLWIYTRMRPATKMVFLRALLATGK